jgi:hypothetical protein
MKYPTIKGRTGWSGGLCFNVLSVDEGRFVVSGGFQTHACVSHQLSSLHRALGLSFQNIRLADREEASSGDAMLILRAGMLCVYMVW